MANACQKMYHKAPHVNHKGTSQIGRPSKCSNIAYIASNMEAKPSAPSLGLKTANINKLKLTIVKLITNKTECGKTASVPKLIRKKTGIAIQKSRMRYFVTLDVSAKPQLILPSENAIPMVTWPIRKKGTEQVMKLNAAMLVLKLSKVRKVG